MLAGWGFFQWLEHPARPPAPYEGHALRLEATAGKLRWAAPALGEHTALVLREVLGMTEQEIARLIDERVASYRALARRRRGGRRALGCMCTVPAAR